MGSPLRLVYGVKKRTVERDVPLSCFRERSYQFFCTTFEVRSSSLSRGQSKDFQSKESVLFSLSLFVCCLFQTNTVENLTLFHEKLRWEIGKKIWVIVEMERAFFIDYVLGLWCFLGLFPFP